MTEQDASHLRDPGDEQSKGFILVVDGDEFSRDLMCRRLRRAGYAVSVAVNGEMALRLIRNQIFDLVLLDVVMPGMDGREVLNAVRGDPVGADIPIIMVTAKSAGSEIADCFGDGASDYITKPFEFNILTARIDTQLARQRAEAALKRSQEELERRVEQRTAELQRANRELEDARSILTDALEAINDGFVLWDPDDRLVTCNRRYRELFGGNASLVVPGAKFEDLMRRQAESGALRRAVGCSEAWLERRFARHRNPDGPFEEEFSDGSWVRMTETRTSDGWIVGLCTDITEVKRREIALKTFAETNRRLAAAVNATTSAILITDPNRPGNPTVFANPAFTDMTGWPVEEALGRNRRFIYGGETDSDAVARLERAMRDGNSISVEMRLKARDGRPFWAEVNASPIRNNEGGIKNWVIIQSNITARKETEEQLHQSQKIEMIGQLTSGLVHDFNSLLTVILENLDTLRSAQISEDPEISQLLGTALDASRRAAQLTRRLLAFARQQPLTPRVTDLAETLRGLEDFVSRSLGGKHEIRMRSAADLWRVLVDPCQMENAILNLAANARDAMAHGGSVSVEAANARLEGAADVSGQPIADGDYVCVSIADSGEGMSPDIVGKAIQPFFTTKGAGKGTGLGLSTVYGFVSQSGGHMRIESVRGHGTTISLYFPRIVGDAETTGTKRREQCPGGTERLLVVEDEPEVRAVAAMELSRLGYRVLQAEDARDALAVLDARGPVDLLVTDIGLRGGANGPVLAAAVRARAPGTKVLFLSGYSEGTSAKAAANDPRAGFLTKPYDGAALARAVRRTLDDANVSEAILAEPAI